MYTVIISTYSVGVASAFYVLYGYVPTIQAISFTLAFGLGAVLGQLLYNFTIGAPDR